jgi:putative ABC transport system ATP-binding protein
VISTRGLQYAYPDGPAFTFSDVSVPSGATLLVRGKSGAGKSTWLSLLAGLRTPDEGEITVAGQVLGELSGPARDRWRARNVGFLPQKLHLSDALTVRRNLELVFYAAGVPVNAKALRHAVDLLGVAHLAGRRPSQLSGGEAQRVGLARSILMQPKVIFADEPTASLDDDAATAGLRLLQGCAAECEATLVIATHDRRLREAMPGALVYYLSTAMADRQDVPA